MSGKATLTAGQSAKKLWPNGYRWMQGMADKMSSVQVGQRERQDAKMHALINNRQKVMTSLVSLMVAGAMTAGLAGPAQAAHVNTETAETSASAVSQASQDDTQLRELTAGLSYIMSIPDSVLRQGDAATQEWVKNHPAPQSSGMKVNGGEVGTYASVLGCSGAIATVIASTAFPAAKILKIKKLVKELGGVAEAAKLFWGASFSYEKVKALGGAAAALAGELIGITQIKEQCFS